MNQLREIPVYKLYGEEQQWLTPDMLHCESIASRSQLHNWQIKPHQHHGLFQILYLNRGKAQIRLDDQQRELHAGQVLAVPQMCIHGFRFSRNAVGHVVTVAYPLFNKIGHSLGDGLAGLTIPQIHRLGDDEESRHIKSAFSMLDTEYKGNAPYRNQLMESLLGAMLVWIVRVCQPARVEQPRTVGRGVRHFGGFCQLVEECYTRHYPVARYAAQLGITAAHLNVLCRQAAGQSALELIHERLLLEAKRNLVYTSMPVSVVSNTLGFSDPAYFTRFFKRQTGLSPKDFRLQARTVFEQAR
jgi:AraC family transcriptional activator of pobA